MKLVITIVQDDYSAELIDVLTESDYRVTKLATTGGFLKKGNTTILTGVKKEEVDKVVSIIKDVCQKRKQIISTPSPVVSSTGVYVPYSVEVEVGGATVFVVDVDQFFKF